MSQRSTGRQRPDWHEGWADASPAGAERLAQIFEIGEYRRRRPGEERPRRQAEPRVGVATVEVPRVVLRGDRNYWLCRCHGFTVFANGRPFGVVIGVRFASRVDRPDALEVRAGKLRQHLALVPVGEVERIDAAERTLVLRRDADGDVPRLGQLRRRLGARPYMRPKPTR